MLSALKSNISSVLQKALIKINPEAYKKRYLGKYINLSWTNYNESEMEFEMLLIPYFLNSNAIFFDIGSNIGSYILVANKYIPQNQIYGFEPIPELNERLSVLFSEAKIHSLALSNIKIKTQFKIPKINHTHFLTRGTLNTNFVEENEQGFRIIDVQTNTLDNFCIEQNIQHIELVKIDVEGHEYEVIKGALKTFKTFKPTLIIEIEQRHHKEDIANIINSIKELGYTCCYFDHTNYSITELKVDPKSLQDKLNYGKNKNYIHNFIFISNDKTETGFIAQVNEKIKNDRKI
jgi:FkbM family methyltransferase